MSMRGDRAPSGLADGELFALGKTWASRVREKPTRYSLPMPCPKDKDSLEYFLWMAMGGLKHSREEVMKALEMSEGRLTRMLRCGRAKSQRFFVQNDIFKKIKALDPEGWEAFGPKVKELVLKLAPLTARRDATPYPLDTARGRLYHLIHYGGQETYRATRILDLSKRRIEDLTSGYAPLTLNLFEFKGWERLLPRVNPDGAAEHLEPLMKLLRDEAARELKAKALSGAEFDSSPQDGWRESVGRFVRGLRQAADETLQQWVETAEAPTLKEEEVWLRVERGDESVSHGVLVEALKIACDRHGLAQLDPKDPVSRRAAELLKEEWREAAGEFVRRLRQETGAKNNNQIALGALNEELRNPQVWEQIERGFVGLPSSTVRLAILETCRHYGLNPMEPSDYKSKHAEQILLRIPKHIR